MPVNRQRRQAIGDDEDENGTFNELLAQERRMRRDSIRAAQRMWGVPEW